eukprot:gene5433-9246_t
MNREDEEEEVINFYESLRNKIINKTEKKWLLEQYTTIEEIIDEKDMKRKKRIFKKLLKILIKEGLLQNDLIKIKDLKLENNFETNKGVLFGKFEKKENTKIHLGSIFLIQGEEEIVTEIIDPKIEILNEYCLIKEWNYIPCLIELPSNSPPSIEFSYLELNNILILNEKEKRNEEELDKFISIKGHIESVSPFFIQEEKHISFYLEIFQTKSYFILLKEDQLSLRNFLNIGDYVSLKNLKPFKIMNEFSILVSTNQTKFKKLKEEEKTKKEQNDTLINYEGKITNLLENGIYEIDEKYILFLTHYSLKNYGRGLRINSEIKLFNIHPIWLSTKRNNSFKNELMMNESLDDLNQSSGSSTGDENELIGFGLCFKSDLRIKSFSKTNSNYFPLIQKFSIFYSFFKHYSIYEFYFIFKNYKKIEKLFDLSHKKILKILNFNSEMRLMNNKMTDDIIQSQPRIISKEFIFHDKSTCQMIKNENNLNLINIFSPLKLMNESKEIINLKSNTNNLILGKINFSDSKIKNELKFDTSNFEISLYLISQNEDGEISKLSNDIYLIKSCYFLNQNYFLKDFKKLKNCCLIVDLKNIEIINKSTNENEGEIKKRKKENEIISNEYIDIIVLYLNELLIECSNNLKIKLKSVDWLHFLNIGHSYRIFNLKKLDKLFYIEDDKELKIKKLKTKLKLKNEISNLNKKNNEIVSFSGLIISIFKNENENIKIRVLDSNYLQDENKLKTIDIYFKSFPIFLKEGNTYHFYRLLKKVSKNDKIYCTIESNSFIEIIKFDDQINTNEKFNLILRNLKFKNYKEIKLKNLEKEKKLKINEYNLQFRIKGIILYFNKIIIIKKCRECFKEINECKCLNSISFFYCNSNCFIDDGTSSFLLFISDFKFLIQILNLSSNEIKNNIGNEFKYDKKIENNSNWIQLKIKSLMENFEFYCDLSKENNFLNLKLIESINLKNECKYLINKFRK